MVLIMKYVSRMVNLGNMLMLISIRIIYCFIINHIDSFIIYYIIDDINDLIIYFAHNVDPRI